MDEENQPSIKESLNTSLEVIAEEPVLRALFNTIPGVGGSLNELLAGKGQLIMEERRDNFLRLLAKHLELLDKEAIKKDYFETDEGFDLLIKALDESRKTRSEQKRDLIARILAGAASTKSEQGSYSPEEYLYVILDLTIQELEVARLIYEERPKTSEEQWKMWEAEACTTLGIDSSDLHMALARLDSRGLLRLVTSGEDEGGPWLDTPEYGEGGHYMVTATFDKLMKFDRLDA
jgi:hypothetical protein